MQRVRIPLTVACAKKDCSRNCLALMNVGDCWTRVLTRLTHGVQRFRIEHPVAKKPMNRCRHDLHSLSEEVEAFDDGK